MGRFIDGLFTDMDVRKYSAQSGTIKNKLDFCKSVIEVVDQFDKLPHEAKDLVEKIYSFIERHNQL